MTGCPHALGRTIRPELPPLPPRMQKLPLDERGYPVPRFVATVNGKPDHRVVDMGFMRTAHALRLCMVCGEALGKYAAFCIGPMCAVNRTASEPPSHTECADYSARACPFLSRPNARRREVEGGTATAGVMIKRNPGVVGVWIVRKWSTFPDPRGATLWNIGRTPIDVRWYREGRLATRAEVLESIETGIPTLLEIAKRFDGDEGVAELEARRAHVAMNLLPQEAVAP